MSEAINAHKKMAMGVTDGNVMKKGGKVAKYASGGAISESAVRNLPAKGAPLKANMTSGKEKIATMKSGGKAKTGLTVMIAVGKPMKKAAGRGR